MLLGSDVSDWLLAVPAASVSMAAADDVPPTHHDTRV